MSMRFFSPPPVNLSADALFVMEGRPAFWCLLRSGKHRCVEPKTDHPVHRCACGEDYSEVTA